MERVQQPLPLLVTRMCTCGVGFIRFDFVPQQYVAGILEEDDPSHAGRAVIGRAATGEGRSFTLYLYDRERHHVSSDVHRLQLRL
jgi:hypothetical protein